MQPARAAPCPGRAPALRVASPDPRPSPPGVPTSASFAAVPGGDPTAGSALCSLVTCAGVGRSEPHSLRGAISPPHSLSARLRSDRSHPDAASVSTRARVPCGGAAHAAETTGGTACPASRPCFLLALPRALGAYPPPAGPVCRAAGCCIGRAGPAHTQGCSGGLARQGPRTALQDCSWPEALCTVNLRASGRREDPRFTLIP